VTSVLTPIIIDDVHPRTPAGFPPKGVLGEGLPVSAVLIADGHDLLGARVRWKPSRGRAWRTAPLAETESGRWIGEITPTELGLHDLVVEAWTDRYATWRHEVEIKVGAGQDVDLELEEGALLLEELAGRLKGDDAARVGRAAEAVRRTSCSLDVRLNAALDEAVARLVAPIPDARRSESARQRVWVDRRRASVGAWYELFPRSFGGFDGSAAHLEYVADLGFDVVYLPPIHPIGHTNRKGPGNTLTAAPDDPGSPWAIGSEEGGHDAVHPELGTIDDFDAFVARAGELGLEVALDYALQCSPDHPWVHEHPEWFTQRPDGSIRYAENPPKKYQDIHPINFWPDHEADRVALWEACRDVLVHWIDHGVRIFRVDNPHTKPVAFWQWLIDDLRKEHPDLVFLAEAFTAPAMMAKLAEVGFSQSYTYFTWRHEAWELREYVTELTQGPLSEYMRPSFWPNTPDILGGVLRDGPRAAFELRLILAATLVPSYGVYSGYELLENEPASEANEEYLHSEKYEIKARDYGSPDSLAPLMRTLNEIRRRHDGLWMLSDIRFHHSDHESFLVYTRGHASGDLLLCIVNLDPHSAHETTVRLDLGAVGLMGSSRHHLHDQLSDAHYEWHGDSSYVRLDPFAGQVAHIFKVTPAD
jgi:starch synthase (maltosyl-transferring)